MRNYNFELLFNPENGAVVSIRNILDSNHMNWCASNQNWGLPISRQTPFKNRDIDLISFREENNRAVSVYANASTQIKVERFFTEKGNLTERFTIKNLRDIEQFFQNGDIRLVIPFNHDYTYAEECMTQKCHAHIWCGGEVSYINALKMGESDQNLGLVLTKGAISSYSIEDCESNKRGTILLNLGHFILQAQEEHVVQWEIFWHKGKKDFYDKAREFPGFLEITSDNFTVFENETIRFQIVRGSKTSEIAVHCDAEKCAVKDWKNHLEVTYVPRRSGIHKFQINCDNIHTYAEFFVCQDIETLLNKRIEYIVDKQQYLVKDSALYGAYLIYDTAEKYPIFDSYFNDHNACRERIGMALLICKYLQTHINDKFRKSLDLYMEFVMREVFNSSSGEVYDGVGPNQKFVRLYNAPWVSMLFAEMYRLTKDKRYLFYILQLFSRYYQNGGYNFYPNGISFVNILSVYEQAGMTDEREQLLQMFKNHADHMVETGIYYPKHEVNFEQTIVTPAVTLISEMAAITGKEKYSEEAKRHIAVLERFNGTQPSFHLNEIPIRFWDDFWFGKAGFFGDTFPHYWSCLTARSYLAYYRISNEEEYRINAERCIRNCLCLFNDKGEGSCAYVYPFEVNGKKGQFYDEWANDQDFALYFYLNKGENAL